MAVIAFIQCIAIDWTNELPFLLAPLVISASLIVTVVSDGWLRIHYLIGAIAWLLVSLASMTYGRPSLFTLAHYCVVGGLTLIVCGFGDHNLLLRTFPRMTRPTIAEGQVDG